jgi:hypothetical protein
MKTYILTTMVAGIHRNESALHVSSLLECGIASVGDCCPKFRDGPLLSCLRVEIPAVNTIVRINVSCYFRKESGGRVSGNCVSYSGVPDFKSEVLYGLS